MILYLQDWEKYPTAIADYETSNKSFVRLAGIYKAMGIENNDFHLALLDPTLRGVNPHSPNLPEHIKYRIGAECKMNPWYFFREVVRLNADGSPDSVPLTGNRGNISLYWLFFNHITTMLIQPRQTGKSVSTDCLMVYLFGIALLNTDVSLLTKDDSLRTKNVKRIKGIMEELPDYLIFKNNKDTYNTENLSIASLGNNYLTKVAQSSVKAALNTGRGMTNAINHIDEIAFISNIETTLPALLAASGAARENSAKAGSYYGNIFTTTAGYLSSADGRYAKSIYDGALRFSEKFFDCKDIDELKNVIKLNNPSNSGDVLLEFNHRQLGYTDEWLIERIRDAKAKGEAVEADFLNIWPEGSTGSPLSPDILKTIKASITPEAYVSISKQGYITRWYYPENFVNGDLKNRKKAAGLDTSDAIGKDDIALVIRDVESGATIACGEYNETNTITFSLFLVELLLDFPNLIMIIERKSSGVSIMDNLLNILPAKGIDPFKRLFNWVVEDCELYPKYKSEILDVPLNRRPANIYDKYRGEFGYGTSGAGRAARDNLYGEALTASAKYTGNTVRDANLISQLTGLVRRNGRIDHGQGKHDDSVIAWLLVYWLLSKAKNKHYYGLNPSRVLTTVSSAIIEENGGEATIIAREKQFKIKREIDKLIEECKETKDSLKVALLLNKVKYLFTMVDTSLLPNFTLDSVMDNLYLSKKKQLSNVA